MEQTVTIKLKNGMNVQGTVARILPSHDGVKILLSSGFIGRLMRVDK